MVIWAVSEVNRYVRRLLEEDPGLQDLWIEGEVSNFTVAMSGHAYFTLKDSLSQLRCVMFRQHLSRARQRPGNGERCVARGPLRVYEPQGVYQLYVEFIAPAGLGELQLRLEELRVRLEAEGLFDPSRKRPLPLWPRRVGVVTSATGAVIHDIRTVIDRRWPLVEIVLAPAPVQGDGAAPLIRQAIEDLNEYGGVDVIVVARGGGSLEDLWPFNDEVVARAIFASRVPIISAIGHETDVTIADLVADHRAPTPSAAAEMIVPDRREVEARLSDLAATLEWHVRQRLDAARAEVARCEARLDRCSPSAVIAEQRAALTRLARRALVATDHRFQLQRERLGARELQLAALDPAAILRRGYSLTTWEDTGTLVRRASEVGEGDRIRTRVADGEFSSRVTRI